jgi:hypothetical protein
LHIHYMQCIVRSKPLFRLHSDMPASFFEVEKRVTKRIL